MDDVAATTEIRGAEPERLVSTDVLGEYEKIIHYGRGGTGKTHTAGTYPEPQWWLTLGGKNEVKTLFGPSFIKKHGKKEAFITAVKEDRYKGQMSDNPSGYDRVCDAVDAMLEWNDREGIGIKSIIVDNGTILEEYMLNKAIMAEYVLASTKDKTTLVREREFGIRKPHDSTWGGAQSFMDRFVNWMFELPFHFGMVCHTYEAYTSTDENNSRNRKLVSVSPLFVGAQRISIPNKFDNVWYHFAQGGGRSTVYGAQTVRDEIYEAKIRVGGLIGELVRDPNVSDIIDQFKQYAHTLNDKES